jgi:hypothetical protein
MFIFVLFYCCEIGYYHYLRTDAVYMTLVWFTSRIVITFIIRLTKIFHPQQTDIFTVYPRT